MTGKIIVGIDGSEHSLRAVQWCAQNAGRLGAEVVAVHMIDQPVYVGAGPVPFVVPPLADEQREELVDFATGTWCGPLADAGVSHRVLVVDGVSAANTIIDIARAEDADLVVVGRRGRGGFAALVLGSTSSQLTHHCDRPLLIVP